MKKIHIIGIGGSGMSAIAKILHEQGYIVTGSNDKYTDYIKQLQDLNIEVFIGHNPQNIKDDVDVVLRSSAISDDNIEVIEAKNKNLAVFKRNDFLNQIIKNQKCIAVSGTHGKTTTSSMLAFIATFSNIDVSYLIGGISKNLNTNAHFGYDDFFVIEADEYDKMFLSLNPYISIITNIEHDHPDCYPDIDSLKSAFLQFIKNTSNKTVVCIDDQNIKDILSQNNIKNYVSYSINEDSDFKAVNIYVNKYGGISFDVKNMHFDLKINGYHNVYNALACIAVCDILNIPYENLYNALFEFELPQKRFDIKYVGNGIVCIDDYAHHPTEIKATLDAIKLRYPQKKIHAIWQPHTFSRLKLLYNSFIESLKNIDDVIVLPVYQSRESQKDFLDVDVKKIVNYIENSVFLEKEEDILSYLKSSITDNDVIVVLSAGDAAKILDKFIDILKTN